MLVCDDEALTALHLQLVLSRLGCEVVGRASTGSESVSLALRVRPDVVLMDVDMPDGNGIEALAAIMNQAPAAVVMVTANADPGTVQQALTAGAAGYLVKPFRDDQLLPALSVARARFHELQAERARGQRALAAFEHAAELEEALAGEQAIARSLAESFRCAAPHLHGLQIGTAYEPASRPDLAGGDFFDFITLAPDRLGVVIGDACGKGLEAAGLTLVARQMLRAYALEDPAPGVVMGRLNRALCHYMADDFSFLSLFFGVLSLSSFSFEYANAGHPAGRLCDPDHQRCRGLSATGGLLGVAPEWRWLGRRTTIPENGALVLFTDGATEARREGRMLGTRGIHQVICDSLAESAENMAGAIVERARTFASGYLKDDLAVVVLRRAVSR